MSPSVRMRRNAGKGLIRTMDKKLHKKEQNLVVLSAEGAFRSTELAISKILKEKLSGTETDNKKLKNIKEFCNQLELGVYQYEEGL